MGQEVQGTDTINKDNEGLTRAVSHFGTLGTVSTICLKVANHLSYSRLSSLSCLSL